MNKFNVGDLVKVKTENLNSVDAQRLQGQVGTIISINSRDLYSWVILDIEVEENQMPSGIWCNEIELHNGFTDDDYEWVG